MLTLTLSTEQKMYQMMKEAYGVKQGLAGKPECKLEYQIATRIHMNAFCFLLKKGMVPEMGEENGRLVLGVAVEGVFHACPVKSIKSVLKNDFADLEAKIPGLAERAMQEEQADKLAQKSHKQTGTPEMKRPNLLPTQQQESPRVNLDAVLQKQHKVTAGSEKTTSEVQTEKKTVDEPIRNEVRYQDKQEADKKEVHEDEPEPVGLPDELLAAQPESSDMTEAPEKYQPEPESDSSRQDTMSEEILEERAETAEPGDQDIADEPEEQKDTVESGNKKEEVDTADPYDTSNEEQEETDLAKTDLIDTAPQETEPSRNTEAETPQPEQAEEMNAESEMIGEENAEAEAEQRQVPEESIIEQEENAEHMEPKIPNTPVNTEDVQAMEARDQDDAKAQDQNVDVGQVTTEDDSIEASADQDADNEPLKSDMNDFEEKPHHFMVKEPSPEPQPEQEEAAERETDQMVKEEKKPDVPHAPTKKKGIGGLFGKFLPKNSTHESAETEPTVGQPKEPATKNDVRDDSEFSDELPGVTLCHTHIIKLKKTFGNAVSDDYVFYIWPIEVIEMYPDRIPSAIFVYAKSPNGTVVQKVSDAKIKYVSITLDEKQFNIFGVWQNGKFQTEVALINKTASVYSKIEVIKVDDPDIAYDSMLDPFRSAKENRKPEYFIVPLTKTNRGQENVAIAAFARVNDKNYVISTPGKATNSLLVTSANITSQITGRWADQQFTFDIQTVETE